MGTAAGLRAAAPPAAAATAPPPVLARPAQGAHRTSFRLGLFTIIGVIGAARPGQAAVSGHACIWPTYSRSGVQGRYVEVRTCGTCGTVSAKVLGPTPEDEDYLIGKLGRREETG